MVPDELKNFLTQITSGDDAEETVIQNRPNKATPLKDELPSYIAEL